MFRGRQLVFGFAVALVGCETLLAGETFTGGVRPVSDGGVVHDAAAPPVIIADAGPDVADAGDPYVAAVLADAPSAYWRLEEVTGVTFHDEIGGHDLTLGGSVSQVSYGQPGARGQSIRLDGNEQLTMAGTFDVSTKTASYSIEAWVKTSDTTEHYRQIFAKMTFGSNSPGDGAYFWVNGGKPLFGFERWKSDQSIDSVYFDELPPADHFTHFIVSVQAGAAAQIYVNGVSVAASGSGGQNPSSNPDTPVVWGQDFDGVLDELAFYQTALTVDQAAAHFAAASK